ncbi:Na(+)-translocating NADH-quinone reductase subunit C [Winogradskyella immobilis]|uniref:Na(+)-translocating NADH-quinone reductase subunit C n=1 Tax=Winogradskyella immobilis TaxID=2816852 RepID=A0ABS8EJL1_9FLAO|nr:Na(+)-translocating NADH-quinone reductase subunit C [Winogradskyella immobilis]MCC1483242.1 Na(+)-translocating NADH-quinone reductase subunit C [Winogradskyella immobilis]MCG0015336.1 Na(+)-translocating NADH-quinone reductase subunit C [Winogradskyella immobilis]
MEKRTDKNTYTVIFAIGMVLVVGALLAFLASTLNPMITENERLEKQKNILYALGVNENEENKAIFVSNEETPKLFKDNIFNQVVIEAKDGKIIRVLSEDEYKEENNNEEPYLIDIKKEQNNAKDGEIRKLPLFLGKNEEGQTCYVVPIRGKGLWDAIWGYISLDKNMIIHGVYFDHKGETPGLGANIKQRFFMDDFIGEHLMKDGVFKGVTIRKGNADPKNNDKTDNEVDAIAGATITGDGVTAMIKTDLKLYLSYFKNLKN